jgi:hypothetical protein
VADSLTSDFGNFDDIVDSEPRATIDDLDGIEKASG